MTHGSLFSGIGGFDLAAEWMGWENVFHCEINEFCNKVLNYYWPNAKSYTDIKETDFTIWGGKIDIISGGFPCQPYSQAGKRKGKADDRHLWPEMLRAIREIQPRWVVGENVSGLLNWNNGMVLDEIKVDLEVEGFEVFPPLVLPACAVNAPHRRDRVWIVAYSNGSRSNREKKYENSSENCGNWEQSDNINNNGEIWWNATNTNSYGCDRSDSKNEKHTSYRKLNALDDTKQITITNPDINGLEGVVQKECRYESQRGETTKRPTDRRHIEKLQVGNRFFGFENFPTKPPICSGNDGLSNKLVGITFPKHRVESIKAYGNSIVPQVVFEIFKAIEQFELLNKKENGKFSSV